MFGIQVLNVCPARPKRYHALTPRLLFHNKTKQFVRGFISKLPKKELIKTVPVSHQHKLIGIVSMHGAFFVINSLSYSALFIYR